MTRTVRPQNRTRLRALIGPNYSEDKSFIGVGNSISVDYKSGRFAIISDDREFYARPMKFFQPILHLRPKEVSLLSPLRWLARLTHGLKCLWLSEKVNSVKFIAF